MPAELAAAVSQRRPGADPARFVASSWDDAHRLIGEYVTAGISKFVIRPGAPTLRQDEFIADFARELMPLQT
jgi:hypothetical protein